MDVGATSVENNNRDISTRSDIFITVFSMRVTCAMMLQRQCAMCNYILIRAGGYSL